uniref:Uncharacterized protein n=1 Tax=Arundo donax TaxID=35708 RepID=A0A0A9EIE3_ARUDO
MNKSRKQLLLLPWGRGRSSCFSVP